MSNALFHDIYETALVSSFVFTQPKLTSTGMSAISAPSRRLCRNLTLKLGPSTSALDIGHLSSPAGEAPQRDLSTVVTAPVLGTMSTTSRDTEASGGSSKMAHELDLSAPSMPTLLSIPSIGSFGLASARSASFASPEGGSDGPSDAEINELVKANVRCVVWDFDLTIMAIHAFAMRIQPEAVWTRDLAADFRDLHFFTATVRKLVAAGIGVAVASFGRFDVIYAYLKRAFGGLPDTPLDDPSLPFQRHNILTPGVLGSVDGFSMRGGKNVALTAIATSLNAQPRELLFFDGTWRPSSLSSS